MKKSNKAILTLACAGCLVIASVFGTLAYLTDDDAVTNTFTVGNVGLSLDEAEVNEDGTYTSDHDNRVTSNAYQLIPGHTYYKDPTVTVDAGSEDTYVRMIVQVDNIDQLKLALPNSGDTAKYYGADGTFLLQMLCVNETGTCTWDDDAWLMKGYTEYKAVEDTEASAGTAIGSAVGDTGVYEFRYKEVVKKSDTATVLEDLFTHITVPGEIDNEHLDCLKNVKIIVNAHAIQADGFENNEDGAWKAFGEQNP